MNIMDICDSLPKDIITIIKLYCKCDMNKCMNIITMKYNIPPYEKDMHQYLCVRQKIKDGYYCKICKIYISKKSKALSVCIIQ